MLNTIRLDYGAPTPSTTSPVTDQYWAPQYNGMGGSPAQYTEEPLIPPHPHVPDERWGVWKWVIVVQGICLIGLAVALLVVVVTHSHDSYAPMPTTAPAIRSVPVGGLIEPSKVAPARSFRFSVSGVFARYPTSGGFIKGLDAKRIQKAQCCCMYKITSKTVRETETCADLGSSRNPLLSFKIDSGDGRSLDANGSFLVVTAGKELLDGRCTLTWL